MRCIQEVHKDMEGAHVPKRLSLTLNPKALNPKTLNPKTLSPKPSELSKDFCFSSWLHLRKLPRPACERRQTASLPCKGRWGFPKIRGTI